MVEISSMLGCWTLKEKKGQASEFAVLYGVIPCIQSAINLFDDRHQPTLTRQCKTKLTAILNILP